MSKRVLHTVVKTPEDVTSPSFLFWCPGCQCAHGVWCASANPTTGAVWTFNGNMDKPTFSPSLKIEGGLRNGENGVCHVIVTDGILNYCGDSTHDLSGQSVPMEPF